MSGYICYDSIVDIFERLPLKSIIRFRSLSKYWHSRLVSPQFVHAYRLRCSKNPQKVLFRHDHCECNSESKDIFMLHPGDQFSLDQGYARYVSIQGVELDKVQFPALCETAVVGSCNGILCLRNKSNKRNTSTRIKEFSLWNFSIRRKLIVPRHPPLTLNSDLTFGFGFDPITDDYKIVIISYGSESVVRTTFVYSLKHGSWSVIPSPFPRFSHVMARKACFFNGILHWAVHDERTGANHSNFILTFNLSSHVFGHIFLPDQPWTSRHKIKQLTTINGCVVVVSRNIYDGTDCWIWMMKEYGKIESWLVCHKLETRCAFDVVGVYQPITNGDILAYYRGSGIFNLQTRLFTKLVTFGSYSFVVEMDTYMESLDLVDNVSATTCEKTRFFLAEKDTANTFCSHI